MGSASDRGGVSAALAVSAGMNVLSLDYRLSREHRFPAHLEDCLKSYRPRQAHEKAISRRYAAAKRIKMTPAMIELIAHYICQDCSPEQVAGHLDRKHGLRISHETIYKHSHSHYRTAPTVQG
jgi:IS30 family transposase